MSSLRKNPLTAYEKALVAAGSAISLVKRVPSPLKSLADQVIRSASSVPANLTEGHGRVGRDRIHHWRIAYASTKEVDCHFRLLMNAGAIDHQRATYAIDFFDEVDVAQDAPPAARAMTWRLLHPKP